MSDSSAHNADLVLRATTEADRTYVARLNFLTDTFGDEHGELPEDFETDFVYYVEGWEPNQGGFIAWRGGVPAGGVWLLWGTEDNHGYGFVEESIPELAIAVEGRFKGEGIGTALLDAATELARTLGAPGISLSVEQSNERAHRLYQHVGFEPVGDRRGHFVLVKRF
ncbi:GNAT family N-acetyltransferase [Corynebacterium incognita]|uniref:GNAT family N-acetyltransferase n=1 Tax=Corynebacterium incognita TaxID=2754725 RepID=A0A7G7CM61_9CORY|nr:N-acetyltransferase [Corynebacterium incognita]QNE88677.1 GNAT family N-acetyltransferase [Corynebacterium incognita]